MRFFFLFMVALLSTLPAYARLGDTYRDSTKRFGKALDYFKDKYAEVGLFEYKGFAIFVIYRNGRSIEESYVLLRPETRSKLKTEKYFDGCMDLLNEPNNLRELSSQHRSMLRTANLKAAWSLSDSNNADGIEKMIATKNGMKVSGDYYPKRKVLVIKNENPPTAPKAPLNELKLAKSLCLPLSTDFKIYIDKFRVPYEVSNANFCCFRKNKNIVKVLFNNKNIERKIRNKQLPEYKYRLISSMSNAISVAVRYEIISQKFLQPKLTKIVAAEKLYSEYGNKDTIDEDLYYDFMIKSGLSTVLPNELQSISYNLVQTLLNSTTESKWTLLFPNKIEEHRYSTWENGRRLFGTYNMVTKGLKIELGMQPEDYKPEVIKKLKEKAEVDALKNF